MSWLTITKQKQLARKAAQIAFGRASNYQIGRMRKKIVELVNGDPSKYLDFHDKYVTPKSDELIINEVLNAD